MPKTPLKVSPLAVIAQEFLEVSLKASIHPEFGAGKLEVHREEMQIEGYPRRWTVKLEMTLGGEGDAPPPPYTGSISICGTYEVSENYSGDPARLIRVTGASMLYGCVREMVSGLTARSTNGMVVLPSVSFYESPPVAPDKKEVSEKEN